MTNSPAAPTPPEQGVLAPPSHEPTIDVFGWLAERETTWFGWGTGLAIGVLCFVFGLRGVYAYWRGETPDKEKAIPSLPIAIGILVFGAWVLWVFWNSKLPGS